MVITVGGAAAGAASEDFEYNGVKYTVSEKFAAEEVPGRPGGRDAGLLGVRGGLYVPPRGASPYRDP